VNDATGQPATRNPYCCERGAASHASAEDRAAAETGFFAQTSIQALQQRGVTFLCCHTALEDQVNRLIGLRHLREPREQIVHEMLAHLLPGILVVPSMAAAIALLQTEGHYSYIKT
jgi:intracellular sulfur oxidation DsrE/DsrF family protein